MDFAELCGLADGDFEDVVEDDVPEEEAHVSDCPPLHVLTPKYKRPKSQVQTVPKARSQARLRGLHRVDRLVFWSDETCATMKGGLFFPDPIEYNFDNFDKSVSTVMFDLGKMNASQGILAAEPFNHVVMLLAAQDQLDASLVAMVLTSFTNLIGLVASKDSPMVACKAISFVATIFSNELSHSYGGENFSKELLELFVAIAVVKANSGQLKQCIHMCDRAIAAAAASPQAASCEDVAEAHLAKATAQLGIGESECALTTMQEGDQSCRNAGYRSSAASGLGPGVTALVDTLKNWLDYAIPMSLFEKHEHATGERQPCPTSCRQCRQPNLPTPVPVIFQAGCTEERAASMFSKTYHDALIFHSGEQEPLLSVNECQRFIDAAEQHASAESAAGGAGWGTNRNR
jgi:hypothetical protein